MEIINILLKTVMGYLILIIIMRFMGKREVGQLNLFDLIILLTIVDLLVVGIENYNDNFFYWIIPVILLGIIQKLIAILLLKIPFLRKIIDGKEALLINKGILDVKKMRKINYNMDDLYTQLRLKDIRSINDVDYAVLETNGQLSVFLKHETNKTFPLPLIVSGKPNKEALIGLDKSEEWLIKELKRMEINQISDVYGASYNEGKIVIVKIQK